MGKSSKSVLQKPGRKYRKSFLWQARVIQRNAGTGCPRCSEERRVSFPEKAVLCYLRKHVKNVLANYREKENSILKQAPQIAKMWHPKKMPV